MIEHILKLFPVKELATHDMYNVFGIKIKVPKKIHYDGKYDNLPIDNHKIVFRSFNGAYTCNPKYIAEEIRRQKLPYKLVWVVNKNILSFIKDFPQDIKLVMGKSNEDFKETATAKFIIDNERRTSYIKRNIHKRKGQIYIQTFHGSFGIKKTGVDRNDGKKKELEICKIDSEQIDYLTSNGTYTTNFFKNMFWNFGKILEYGHPRNDIFFRDDKEYKEKVYKYFNIPLDKKVVMYAPTLREDGDITCYSLDIDMMKNALEKKFGGEWIVITRLHPLMIDRRDEIMPKKDYIIEGTEYSDMQELLAAVDVLVTDYSSCIYDFVLSRKPGFLYAADSKKYDNSRGFYYPLSSTPFPVAQNNKEMLSNIENFDNEKYQQRVEEFLKGKGSVEDGHASERVVELIKEITEKADNENKTQEETL
jgi:CDP-glycerol glycerophosphotransferase